MTSLALQFFTTLSTPVAPGMGSALGPDPHDGDLRTGDALAIGNLTNGLGQLEVALEHAGPEAGVPALVLGHVVERLQRALQP